MIRAIDDFPTVFIPFDSEPIIIDCGANIGISVLEWKSRWPMSRVICFEPDPSAFRLLQMNIERNDIPGVTCIEAALSDCDGSGRLYGDHQPGADSRGNSIDAAWGERDDSTAVEVACTRLSPYLTEPVALLKIDIEGAEGPVLREISTSLCRVAAIHVEVHETLASSEENSACRIAKLLSRAGFDTESKSRFEPHALPPEFDDWRCRVDARQTQIFGWRP